MKGDGGVVEESFTTIFQKPKSEFSPLFVRAKLDPAIKPNFLNLD